MIFPEKISRNKFVKTTAIDAMFYFIAYLYIGFFSPYLTQLGWSEGLKGLFFSTFSITSIIVAPVIGTLSDKVGRFRLILLGFVIEMFALLGYIFITNPIFIFSIRILSAIGFNLVVITALSRVNDVMQDKQRSKLNGLFQTVISLATMIAPLIGGFVADRYGLQAVFVVALIVCISIFLSIIIQDYLFFKDGGKKQKRNKVQLRDGNPLADIKDMLSFKELRAISILGICSNFTAPFLILVLPYLIIEKMGLTNTHLSIAMFFVGGAHLLQYFFGIYIDKIGKEKGIYMGLIILAFAIGMIFFVNSYELLLAFIVLKAIGGGLWNISAISYMSDVGEKHKIEGKVIGSYNSLVRISMAISFGVSGFILSFWGTHIFLIYGIIVLAPLLFVAKTILKGNKIQEIVAKKTRNY